MRSFKSYLGVALKGMGMGAADVVPGVSGGTIAFMTGIYQELVDSIRSIDADALKLLFKGKFKEFWRSVNGNFLLAVAIGILFSVFTLAKLMQYLLVAWPVPTWSFFFGLILSSTVFIIKGAGSFRLQDAAGFAIGAALGVLICLASPAKTPDNYLFLFICGAIAVCAMILPGISGSFILLLLGKYAFMLDAVSNFDIAILLIFVLGGITGLLCFSHFLSWLLKNFYQVTLYLLCGLMCGSLLKVWPWKETLASGTDKPLLPSQYAGDPQLALAFAAMLVGVALVSAINLAAAKSKKK